MTVPMDALVIGGGTAGNAASRALAAKGLTVAVAEPGKVGGTCLWNGCMPKKALYNSAMAYQDVKRAEEFGVLARGVELDWPSVLAWKWHSQETYAGDQEGVMASRGIKHLSAAARFISPTELQVGTEVFSPGAVIVATGSRAVIPSIPGVELADTSDEALRFPELPASLIIIGAGYIGMEFAGIYASFGTEVTMLVRDSVLASFDAECVAIAVSELQALGVRFVYDASVTQIEGVRGDLIVRFTTSGDSQDRVSAERVLVATGRLPALDELNLDAADVHRDELGLPVLDASLRSTNPRVWFAGDATGQKMLTPVAHTQGVHVAQSIITGQPTAPDTSAIPTACFTVPALAQVGINEAEATARGISHRVIRGTPEYVGAAIITDRRAGLVKVLVTQDGIVLGAHIAGHDAADLVYPYALAIRAGLSIAQLAGTSAIHPALTELINWTVT
ncbi:MAG: NAD(P)/FAD-dependent oxidoreductase [Coriobacteriia bacterium]|nr:NAD(P)/FAD-dependent oxidoreductase [Coriobacteriia bacterium]MBN2823132.1 NAD(P)/FAD-dependent oxidoreductase [Coriobacteriia bacterium]